MNRTVSISLDDDDFFDSNDRLSSVVAVDLGDDGDEFYEASRMSFARGGASIKRIYSISPVRPDIPPAYDMWIAEPGDLKERRKRLLQGMGLASNKDLFRLATTKVVRTVSIKPPDTSAVDQQQAEAPKPQHVAVPVPVPVRAIVLVRSRSDGDIDVFSTKTKQRKLDLLGPVSKNKLIRTLSGQLVPSTSSAIKLVQDKKAEHKGKGKGKGAPATVVQDAKLGSFFLIKNLDTGTDFIVKEFNEEGMWNKLNDLQTGKQLTMDEFDKSVGYSPVVTELMRRASKKHKKNNSHFTKSFRSSTKKGSAILKNLKGAASGFLVVEKMEKAVAEKADKEEKEDKDNINVVAAEQKVERQSPQWVDAHQHGKSFKEFTALHFSQEIQAHEGSIWTMRFSSDARFLASAGEDTHVHVWEVRECEVAQPKHPAEDSSTHATPDPADEPTTDGDGDDASNSLALAEFTTMKKGKKAGKGAPTIPDYVKLPEMVIGLSEKPKYTLKGHKDEVLDLAWSQSQVSYFNCDLNLDIEHNDSFVCE